MIKYSDFKSKTRTITVKHQEETCEITYRLNVLTPEAAKALDEKRTDAEVAVDEIVRLVENWDIVDGEGKRYPPSEIAATLPTAFLWHVINECLKDMREQPDRDEKKS